MESLSDKVARTLRSDIIAGRIAVGERMKEDALAAQFGVSRVPVREALRQLETEGFVVIQKFKGATVSTKSHRDLTEYLQIRRSLEMLAASLAAARHGGEQASQLREVVEIGRKALAINEIERLPPLILRFHEIVALASGNDRLIAMLQDVFAKLSWGFDLDMVGRIESSWAEHFAIAEAILAGAPEAASYLMGAHIVRDEGTYRQGPLTTSPGDDEGDAANAGGARLSESESS